MDLSATFRSSMRLSMTGVTHLSMHPSITHMLFCSGDTAPTYARRMQKIMHMSVYSCQNMA